MLRVGAGELYRGRPREKIVLLKTGSLYVVILAVLNFTMYTRFVSKPERSSCLCPLSSEIKCLCYMPHLQVNM